MSLTVDELSIERSAGLRVRLACLGVGVLVAELEALLGGLEKGGRNEPAVPGVVERQDSEGADGDGRDDARGIQLSRLSGVGHSLAHVGELGVTAAVATHAFRTAQAALAGAAVLVAVTDGKPRWLLAGEDGEEPGAKGRRASG